jgi:hypothetical protein
MMVLEKNKKYAQNGLEMSLLNMFFFFCMMSVSKTATKNIGPLVNRERKARECTGTIELVMVASLN